MSSEIATLVQRALDEKNGHITSLERVLQHLRDNAGSESCADFALRNADLERQLAAKRSSELFDELGVAQNNAQMQIGGELTRQLAEMTADRDNLRQLIEASDVGPLFERLDAQHARIAELEHVVHVVCTKLQVESAGEQGRNLVEAITDLEIATQRLSVEQCERIATGFFARMYASATSSERRRFLLAAIAEVCGPVKEEA